MAKKYGSKEGISQDPSLSVPCEQQKMSSESNKQKIAKIHDIFPDATTKDNIAKILQYYEDDENQVIDALYRDGGCEALSNWAESGNSKNKNNKNKKKKRKGRKEFSMGSSATASFDADDSSSLHSSGNVDAEGEKEELLNGSGNSVHDSMGDNTLILDERLNTPEMEDISIEPKVLDEEPIISSTVSEIHLPVPEDSKCPEIENPVCVSPISDSSEKLEDHSCKRDKYRSVREESHGRYSGRQRTNSFRRSKTSSLSEDSTSQFNSNSQATAMPTKRGYEKCKKDLNRQTISLTRIYTHVEKSLEESSKKLKNVFNDIRNLLDERQEKIESELTKTKEDALNLLKSRQDTASDLKRGVDRAQSISEAEWTELRSRVKQFVSERKFDDELGKTIWFQWSIDSITESIQTFCDVQPVKNVYSQRSHSALSNIIASSNPEPSPSSSLANEEIGSATDKNDVANILDAIEDESLHVKKENVNSFTRVPMENRPRIFSNTKFHSTRGRGINRGSNRGSSFNNNRGFPRPNNRNNYRNNYMNHDFPDYRNNPYANRDGGRTYNNVMHPNDRNMNSHRNERRGRSLNYSQSSGRYNNRGHQRYNNIGPKPEPNENSGEAGENSNITNGL